MLSEKSHLLYFTTVSKPSDSCPELCLQGGVWCQISVGCKIHSSVQLLGIFKIKLPKLLINPKGIPQRYFRSIWHFFLIPPLNVQMMLADRYAFFQFWLLYQLNPIYPKKVGLALVILAGMCCPSEVLSRLGSCHFVGTGLPYQRADLTLILSWQLPFLPLP